MDFLNYIPDRVSLNRVLVSFDVTSLYTNIPLDLGIKAVIFWLEKNQADIPTWFPSWYRIWIKISARKQSHLF